MLICVACRNAIYHFKMLLSYILEEETVLNENIKVIRKQKGFSQEQLAMHLNVVRQTVSKWEQGLSVPDALILTKIADLFDVEVSELLGKKIYIEEKEDSLDKIATELSKLNEILVMKYQKREQTKKRIFHIIEIALILLFICAIYDEWNRMFYELGQSIYNLFN